MAGMEMGLSLMLQCREIWVFGERMSEGMLREISYAVRHGILTRYFSGADGNFSESLLIKSQVFFEDNFKNLI